MAWRLDTTVASSNMHARVATMATNPVVEALALGLATKTQYAIIRFKRQIIRMLYLKGLILLSDRIDYLLLVRQIKSSDIHSRYRAAKSASLGG